MENTYLKTGYSLSRAVFDTEEIAIIKTILQKHHSAWLKDNLAFYKQGAINSAFLTDKKYLSPEERQTLFNFISQDLILDTVNQLIPDGPTFMNTQLFFNPCNSEQKNYWHRDLQYNDMSIEEQKKVLTSLNVIHVRIAFEDEPGLELIPGTHKRWDTPEEVAVRLQLHSKKNHFTLPKTKKIPLKSGDMLVFSANMIHRGLYGMGRFALDILYCDPKVELVKYAELDCLPDTEDMQAIRNSTPFELALKLKQQST